MAKNVDPARLIWGDAVIDEAERIDDAAYRGEKTQVGSGAWHHASGRHPMGGSNCCIVGHLNFLAAELAGKDPIEERIDTWPSRASAMRDLKKIDPDAPDAITIDTKDGPRTIATESFIDKMIRSHDAIKTAERRKGTGWWGRKLYRRSGKWFGFRLLPPEEPAQSAKAFVEEIVPERVAVEVPA